MEWLQRVNDENYFPFLAYSIVTQMSSTLVLFQILLNLILLTIICEIWKSGFKNVSSCKYEHQILSFNHFLMTNLIKYTKEKILHIPDRTV